MDGEGGICADELGSAGIRGMEGQRYGVIAVCISSKKEERAGADCGGRTTRSDWLAWETARVPLEQTVFAFK